MFWKHFNNEIPDDNVSHILAIKMTAYMYFNVIWLFIKDNSNIKKSGKNTNQSLYCLIPQQIMYEMILKVHIYFMPYPLTLFDKPTRASICFWEAGGYLHYLSGLKWLSLTPVAARILFNLKRGFV